MNFALQLALIGGRVPSHNILILRGADLLVAPQVPAFFFNTSWFCHWSLTDFILFFSSSCHLFYFIYCQMHFREHNLIRGFS